MKTLALIVATAMLVACGAEMADDGDLERGTTAAFAPVEGMYDGVTKAVDTDAFCSLWPETMNARKEVINVGPGLIDLATWVDFFPFPIWTDQCTLTGHSMTCDDGLGKGQIIDFSIPFPGEPVFDAVVTANYSPQDSNDNYKYGIYTWTKSMS